MATVVAKFELDGVGEFTGTHDPGKTWNGFACPSFMLDEVERIAASLVPYCDIAWDGAALTIEHADGERDEIRPVNGLYDMSLGWTWTVTMSD